MKTYSKEFSIEGNILVHGASELEEVINNRQEKFMVSVGYRKVKEEATEALRKIKNLLPEDYRTLGDIEAIFFNMECLCYSAAYRDGIADLMTSMTFNKLSLTKAECFDLSKAT